ncbi:hypothetical protein TNCV_2822971 [Trichonephila clavipes]|nr:hypothetical protein TNCV_2822971 [Trichonephila clavipes]
MILQLWTENIKRENPRMGQVAPSLPFFGGFPSPGFRPSFAIHSEQKRLLAVARHRSCFRSFRGRSGAKRSESMRKVGGAA